MKIVFMGTPDFAKEALEAIINSGQHEVIAVVTQPDKPNGRGGRIQFSAVKECAIKYNIPVFQPEKIRKPECVEQLKKYGAEIYVVAAFGQILSREILEMPKYGCVNIHASLLPKYRGAAPINWCIINGENETGITIMQMDEGVDTGDIITQKSVSITSEETAGSLFDKLSKTGAELIIETLPMIENGEINPTKQDESLSSHTSMMEKSLGKINWESGAEYIERLVRGLNPWPSAYTSLNGKSLKLWRCSVVKESAINDEKPGTIINIAKDYFDVLCGKGVLRVSELQLEGKKRMDTKSFLLGSQLKEGTCLGDNKC